VLCENVENDENYMNFESQGDIEPLLVLCIKYWHICCNIDPLASLIEAKRGSSYTLEHIIEVTNLQWFIILRFACKSSIIWIRC